MVFERTEETAVKTATDDSYARTLDRFNQPEIADAYPKQYSDGIRARRERETILAALGGVRPGSRVLDLPCGKGRLLPLLVERGFEVTAADSSPIMLAQARQAWSDFGGTSRTPGGRVDFDVQDIMKTTYDDGQFDAVVSNRLFHHFAESPIRRAALAELRRICGGRVIVSFFNSFALDTLRRGVRHVLFGERRVDRFPISLRQFAEDGRAAGLEVVMALPTWWAISPQWYVVFRHAWK
jgi:SAM-dependent methyltransferase